MWGHLIKLLSLGKGALVIGVAASAAVVSNAEIANTHQYTEPSATPIVSVSPSATPTTQRSTKPTDKPKSTEQPRSTEPGKPDVSGLVKECLAKYAALRAAGDNASNGDRESTAAVCKHAIEESGLSTKDFGIKYGFDTLPTASPSAPKTEHHSSSLDAAIHQCLIDWRNYAETSSAACAQALAASGLSTEDFWRKFEAWAVEQPYDTDTTADLDALVKECSAKYTAKDPTTLETCKKAMAASGLSGDAFWDKYGRPTPPSSAPKSSTSEETYKLMALCFKLHSALTPTSEKSTIDAAYDACNKAIAASGMSVNEFWTKFASQLAPVKPSASPKSSTSEETSQLIATCIRLRNQLTDTSDTRKFGALTEACSKAFAATGMTSLEFWTKFGGQLTNNPYAPKPSATPSLKPVTNPAEVEQLVAKCLDLYKNLQTSGDTKSASDACKAAIVASGISSADFWAKYHPTVN